MPMPRIRTAASVLTALLASTLAAPPARAIVGVEGTMEYAIDAPWRIEPAALVDGVAVYDAIPITISIHDVDLIGRDHDYLDSDLRQVYMRLGRVCSVIVRQRAAEDGPGDDPSGPSAEFPAAALEEMEYTFGRWPAPGDPDQGIPHHELCRAWAGEDCALISRLPGTSDWFGSLRYPPVGAGAGGSLSLQVEVRVARDPDSDCADLSSPDFIRLINEMRIDLAPEGLPRFGPDWLYGDLHYHSQGTDNEGESGHSYRGVLRAMGPMGLDFAFATEHASNSPQIIDVDAELGDIFDIEWPPDETRLGLRDMSATRFSFLDDLLNLGGGANQEAAAITTAGPAEPAARLRPVPQLFLGGEVDLIPELPPDTHFGDSIPWGNGQTWNTDNLCFGNIDILGIVDINCESLGYHLLEQTATDPEAVLVDDVQAFSVDFGRHHIVYLPRTAAREAFVRSDTGPYGGAHRRFKEMRSEIEAHGYFFAAHSFSHYERDGFLTDPGPTDIPWTDHMYDQVWRSSAFLGLQFWNEDARLKNDVEKWSATTLGPGDPLFVHPAFCAPGILICPTPGDDIGYERYDSHILGIPYALLPVQNAQAGFGTGLFHLDVTPPKTGRWQKHPLGVEEKLHHGAFTLDRLNHWGLDIRKTLDLSWLPDFLAPRRLFMAGGSDAHADLNYRRTGYLVKTETINDDALGKPRNLVDAGPARGPELARGPGLDPVQVHSQDQVADALAAGRFSITDGPALRIAVDRNGDGAIDPGDAAMGEVVRLGPDRRLPLLIEWKSTPEFGAVRWVDLYVGARSSAADFAAAAHEDGRTYAPVYPGVLHPSIPGFAQPDNIVEDPPYNEMNDHYWEDPTADGLLKVLPEQGQEYAGTRSLTLDLTQFPAMHNAAADRFFVRAYADTVPPLYDCGPEITAEHCLSRYAFANPIWAQDDTFLCSAEAGLDTTDPVVACNTVAMIVRQSLPKAFTATADDVCGAALSIGNVQCFTVNRNGVRTQRQCTVATDGGRITIQRAEGTGTIITWTVTATDPSGHVTTIPCQTQSVNGPASMTGGIPLRRSFTPAGGVTPH
jgi:hypothetical protein